MLISDLIDVPLQVQDGDFVLKLTQGVNSASAAQTVDQYVVTGQLAEAFDAALGLVASAVSDGQSKATYLQGSFGSGKSHFMAMLHLLLGGDVRARSKPELHGALAKWDPHLAGKRFLLVPVHFLDAVSMEQKIFGGYVDRVAETDPDGGLPSVFLGDEIVATELPALRARIGDEAFLAGLNNTGGADADEWGDFAQVWTTESLDRALGLPATDPERAELVQAYVSAYRAGTVLESASTGKGYLDLDRGLAALSRHAQSCGYDGVVLFLDELILWLASNISNLEFVHGEAQKLTKLVEASAAGRPVPIISFVARQRDLQELVGEHTVGAALRSFADTLEQQSGRFKQIVLTAGNLPLVAKQRLLAPVDDAAGAALAGAVDTALGNRDDVRRLLLGRDADLDVFRTVYPFSPALVTTLIDVSEALQRERTALKVMLQLLVDQRDTLELGQIIPVGDLWDVVAGRDEPFSSELRALFDTAKRLWRAKILPALQRIHGVDDSTPADALARVGLGIDARLMKTILLAALVPENEALANLDAQKLAALNWGSIKAPIPGAETQVVVGRLQRIVGHVGELNISDDSVNPTIHLRLANVDTDDIVRRAIESYDTPGGRRQKIRTIITSALDDRIGNDLEGTFAHTWRGVTREVDVVFGNIRDTTELTDSALAQVTDRPRLVIDFPFDDSGRSPEDDLERLDAWDRDHEPTVTVCWLPSFFHREGNVALREFVALDELFKHDRFDQHTAHLSATERLEAKPILEARRNQLGSRLREAIRAAYGIVSNDSDPYLDPANTVGDHYRSLHPSLKIRPTTSPTIEGAVGQICDQIFDWSHPGHPRFEAKVTPAQLRTTWTEVRRALADPEGRIVVESANRKTLRNVALALELGVMGDAHFVLGTDWRNRLDRHLAAGGGGHTVAELRHWIDEAPGGPRGLDPEIADLVVLTVAAQTDHRLMDGDRVYGGDAGRAMPSGIRLVPEQLPDAATWTRAVNAASALFGATFQNRVTGPELTSLGNEVRTAAAAARPGAQHLVDALSRITGSWRAGDGRRQATATASRDLVVALASATDDKVVVDLLATYNPPEGSSLQASARSLATASDVAAVIGRTNFTLWDTARPKVAERVEQLLREDELTQGFETTARQIEVDATTYIQRLHAPATTVVEAGEDGRSVSGGAKGRGPGTLGADDVISGVDQSATTTGITTITTTVTSTVTRRTVHSLTELDELRGEIEAALERHGGVEISWPPEDRA